MDFLVFLSSASKRIRVLFIQFILHLDMSFYVKSIFVCPLSAQLKVGLEVGLKESHDGRREHFENKEERKQKDEEDIGEKRHGPFF